MSALSLDGCATIVRGTRQQVSIETVPANATILDERTGETSISPVVLDLTRRQRHEFLISKEGYKPQSLYIRSEASFLWWFIDAFSLGVGNALDALLGGLYDLKPARPYIVLEPAELGAPE